MPVKRDTFHSTSNFRVSVDGLEFYFAEKTGGDDASEVSRTSNGQNKMVPVQGAKSVSDITLTKPFNGRTDAEVISWYKNFCSHEPTILSIEVVDSCPTAPTVGVFTYTGVVPSGLTYPTVNQNSGDVATLQLTLTAETVEYEALNAN